MRMPHDGTFFWKCLWLLSVVLRPLCSRGRVYGREHVPETGGVVLAGNHNMGPDFVIIGHACPRQVYYMAKREAFEVHPLLTRFLHAVGTFPVDRGRRDMSAFAAGLDLLRTGRVIGMFPEGTRSRTGALQRGKSGAVRMAMEAQVPILPVAVVNSPAVMKGFLRFPKPEVTVRFGPAFMPEGSPDDPEAVRRNTVRTMQSIAALLPPEMRGPYGEKTEAMTAEGEPTDA